MHSSSREQQLGQAALGAQGLMFLQIDLAGRWGSSGAAGHQQLPIRRKFRKCLGFRPVWTETKCREKPPENFCRPNSPSPTVAAGGVLRGHGGVGTGAGGMAEPAGIPGTASSSPRPHALTWWLVAHQEDACRGKGHQDSVSSSRKRRCYLFTWA